MLFLSFQLCFRLLSDILDQPIGVDPVSPPDVPAISPLRALLDNNDLFVGTFDCEVCFLFKFYL